MCNLQQHSWTADYRWAGYIFLLWSVRILNAPIVIADAVVILLLLLLDKPMPENPLRGFMQWLCHCIISAISKDDVVTAFLASNAMSFK